jgi:hypothetical protein
MASADPGMARPDSHTTPSRSSNQVMGRQSASTSCLSDPARIGWVDAHSSPQPTAAPGFGLPIPARLGTQGQCPASNRSLAFATTLTEFGWGT